MRPLLGGYKAEVRGAASEDPQQRSWTHPGPPRFLSSSSSSSRGNPQLWLARWSHASFRSRAGSAAGARTWRSPGRRAWPRGRRGPPVPCCSSGSGPTPRPRPSRPSCSRGDRSSASCDASTAAVRRVGAVAASEEYQDS